ncbi:MAG TPA: hypothetical protein PKN86_16990 [Candidatus Obscuribacter sp.]|nr:hypothetical protein [Candidatus Obscuribacter sp.]
MQSQAQVKLEVLSPALIAVPNTPDEVQQSADVQRLELLLGKIFNDEIEKALQDEHQFSQSSSEVGTHSPVHLPSSSLLDFTPFFEEAKLPVQEQTEIFFDGEALTQKNLVSIFGGDDDDHSLAIDNLNQVIEAQRRELVTLRQALKTSRDDARILHLDLADKDDQLAALPELIAAPLLKELELEKAAHASTASHLVQAQGRLAKFDQSLWVKLAKLFGLSA